jgi:2-polyprenylphenol 6-hydroxylase
MTQRSDFDVAVVGRGAVGAASALGLAQSGLRVALVGLPEGASVTAGGSDDWDARVFALSPATRALLHRLRVWQSMPASRIAPVYDMRIQPRAGTSATELHFDAYRARVDALAWIVENRALAGTLVQAAAYAGVTAIDANVDGVAADEPGPAGRVRLRLDGGRELSARLVVAADGAESPIREAVGIASHSRDYPQRAVVANFDTARPHGDCAWQWFGAHGVLALLPLPAGSPERGRCSMVWSAPSQLADELLALPQHALAAQVADVSGGVLGEMTMITAPRTFRLRLVRVDRLIANRTVLVGDAAHVIHPLAGQGMNLGFGDVGCLLDVVAGREPYRDLSDPLLWRRYERARRTPVASMQQVTDGLQRLFGPLPRPIEAVRDLGWELVARSPWIRRQLVSRAAG